MYIVHVIAVQHLNNSNQAKIYLWKCSFRVSGIPDCYAKNPNVFIYTICLCVCMCINILLCEKRTRLRMYRSGVWAHQKESSWAENEIDRRSTFCTHFHIINSCGSINFPDCVSQKRRETSQNNTEYREREIERDGKKEKSAHMRNGIGKRFKL